MFVEMKGAINQFLEGMDYSQGTVRLSDLKANTMELIETVVDLTE
jgi:hypothetical protein